MANSDGYPWESEDDRLQYTRVFVPSRAEQLQMAAALQVTSLRSEEIRRELMRPFPMPARYGYNDRGTDILTCWEQPQVTPVRSIMDYTDDEAGLQSTSRPSIGQW